MIRTVDESTMEVQLLSDTFSLIRHDSSTKRAVFIRLTQNDTKLLLLGGVGVD